MRPLYLTAFLFLLTSFLLKGQEQYYFDTYSVKDGLSQSRIYATYQDSVGNLWIGTPSGVSLFDGNEFKNYTSADGLSDNGVAVITCDKNNIIWFGHWGGGVTYFDGKEFHKLQLPGIEIDSDVTDIVIDDEQNVWVATIKSGAFKLSHVLGSNIRVKQYKGKEGLSDQIFGILKTKKGKLHFVIVGGIKEYIADENGFSFFRPEGLPKYFQYTCFFEDSRENLWFGTYNDGVYRFNKETATFDFFDIKNGLGDNWISCFTEDQMGNVWAGTTRGGVTRFEGDSLKTFKVESGLPDNFIRSLMVDREGNIIIGTFNSGLAIFKGEQFITYYTSLGLPAPEVNAILHDSGGDIWIGTIKGLLRYNPKTGEKKKYPITIKGAKTEFILAIREDKNNDIWVGTKDGGVLRLDKKTDRFVYVPRANPSRYSHTIKTFDIDPQNNLWVATGDGLVYYEIANNSYNVITQSHGLANNDVRSVFADSQGRVWAGTNSGITLIEGEKITRVKIDSTLKIDGDIIGISFAEDRLGNIWIGTEDDGVLLFNGQQISKQYQIEDGLLSNFITALVVDDNDNLWVGTGAGVNQFNIASERIHYYNEKSGFTGIEVRRNATFKDTEGNIWFGTAKGINVFNQKYEKHSNLEPLTRITRLRINLKDRTFDPKITINLSHEEHAVHINYASVWLSNPEGVSYKVMLEGLDADWQPETKQTDINYPYLKPGTYTFKVKAKNHEGIWNESPTQITFTINPPFWQTWWFILSSLAAITALIYFYILWRERNHRLEREKLERTVKERTAEIEQKSEELAAKNRDILDSIRYAKRIQTAVMPNTESMEEALPEHFILFRPRDIVSGDYYWMSHVDGKVIITAVDCTGHGVPGAFLSMLGISFLNEIVSKGLATSAADILEHLREYVINSLKQRSKESDSQDGMDMGLCIIDTKKQELQFSGANNPMLIYSNGESQIYKADKMPIGIYQRLDRKFTNHTIKYQKGDTFYIFSDGYPDQFGGPKNRKFMRKRFQELLQELQKYDMARQRNILDSEFEKWKGEREQIDDVLVIGVRL